MGRLELIRDLLEHDTWAREQLLAFVEECSPEELTRDLGPLASLRERLTHIADIDELWVQRIYARQSPRELPSRKRFTSRVELIAYTRQATASRARQFGKLSEAQLDEVVEFTDTRGNPYRETVGDMLLQVVLHSAHHRGQVALCLKALGRTVPDVDYYIWAGKHRAQP